jgi:hypothetical protein
LERGDQQEAQLLEGRPAEDKVMPVAAGRRLAASFPDSRFVEIPNSRTLIPVDQPRALAGAIATFASDH